MTTKTLSYKSSGVDIIAAEKATERIKGLVKKTYNKSVLNEVGGFGGFFSAKFEGYEDPVLISSADGVGTKLKLAFMTGVHNTVGQDLVNHCVNDILVHGAKPIYFLDYFATGKLAPNVVADVISGMAKACKANGCALIGGETAEMPGFYKEGEYDLAGFIVGVVDKRDVIDGSEIRPGDAIIGLASTGMQTNGFSLARKLFFEKLKLKPSNYVDELGCTVADALMKVHGSFLNPVHNLRSVVKIHGLAHITGGGIPGNLVRVLPKNCRAKIDKSSWKVPKLFDFIQRKGQIDDGVMFETFNMGIGMIAVVDAGAAEVAISSLAKSKIKAFKIGSIVAGKRKVVFT